MMILTGKTIASAIRPPYPYGSEFVGQFLFAMKLCWFPLLISTIAFGYEAPGLQAANFLVLFGALDRLGGFFVLASIREFAPFVDAIVLAGVAGTAITADLGARKIREVNLTRSPNASIQPRGVASSPSIYFATVVISGCVASRVCVNA